MAERGPEFPKAWTARKVFKVKVTVIESSGHESATMEGTNRREMMEIYERSEVA